MTPSDPKLETHDPATCNRCGETRTESFGITAYFVPPTSWSRTVNGLEKTVSIGYDMTDVRERRYRVCEACVQKRESRSGLWTKLGVLAVLLIAVSGSRKGSVLPLIALGISVAVIVHHVVMARRRQPDLTANPARLRNRLDRMGLGLLNRDLGDPDLHLLSGKQRDFAHASKTWTGYSHGRPT